MSITETRYGTQSDMILNPKEEIDMTQPYIQNGDGTAKYEAIIKSQEILDSSKNEQLLPEIINSQIQSFVDVLEEYNSKLPKERRRKPDDYKFIRHFYPSFVIDRNMRGEEIISDAYKDMIVNENTGFPMRTLFVQCMDGRVKPIHTNGASAEIGKSLRVPAGNLKEFVRSTDGQFTLRRNSLFGRLLDNVIDKGNKIAEVFDSHVGCAARMAEEQARGEKPEDSGLKSDVLHKRELISATKKYLQKKDKKDKAVFIQTSFDPHSGYMYMGLEKEKALASNDFCENELQKLTREGVIISTEDLSRQEVIARAFRKNEFVIDWKSNYSASARSFWKSINAMKDEVIPHIEEKVMDVFPELNAPEKADEVEERVMLLLTNAFNGYLHNIKIEYSATHKHGDHTHSEYQYGEHEEEGIKVSEGGYPPYQIPMFVVFSGDEKNLPSHIELASNLVRNNRRDGRVFDRSKSYPCANKDDFAKAPVPVVMQEIIRDERLADDDWSVLQEIDWSDLPNLPWDKWSTSEFLQYLEDKKTKNSLSSSIALGLDALRRKMTIIFDPDQATSSHLIEQFKVVLPLVADGNRKTYAIIPFIKTGIS